MENKIKISNLIIKYGKQNVINDISLNIKENTFTVIVGKNGSGKSTIIKALMNLIKYKGLITIGNKDIKKIKSKELAKKIAYVPQIMENIQPTSVYDYISFGRFPYSGSNILSKKDKNIIKEVVNRLKLQDIIKKSLDNLSGGQRQKVAIATALVQKAPIIILDEPTTYMDIRNQYEILEIAKILKEQGITLITVIHELNQVIKYAEEVIIVNNKKIAFQGVPKEALNKKRIKKIFEVDVVIDKNDKFIKDINTKSIYNQLKLNFSSKQIFRNLLQANIPDYNMTQ